GKRHHLHPRHHEVGDGGFHSAAAGGGDDEVQIVGSAEDFPQHALNVGGYLEEIGIEVADDGLRHRPIDAGMNLTGTRAKQQAPWRMNRNVFHNDRVFQSSSHEQLL